MLPLVAVLVGVLAIVLGPATLVVLWPVAAVGAAVLHCLDRPLRRTAWPVLTVVLLAAGVTFRLGDWHPSPGRVTTVALVLGPLVLAGLIVLAAGGPARIRARHERAAELRRQAHLQRRAARRQVRKDAVRNRTGVDVDLLGAVTRDRAGRLTRAVGSRLNRRLEKRRPRPSPGGRPQWLDLDDDVSADLSRQRSAEILDLAAELDRSRERPRPHR